jgi:hypothetical protein
VKRTGSGQEASAVTEDQARVALRNFVAVVAGDIEHWIAEQRWEPAPSGGWAVLRGRNGWSFRLEPVADGLRVVMSVRGGEPADWIVPAR